MAKTTIDVGKVTSRYFQLLGLRELEICHDALGPLIDLSRISEFKALGPEARFLTARELASRLKDTASSSRAHTVDEIYGIIASRLSRRIKDDNLLMPVRTIREMIRRGAPLTIYSSVGSRDVWKEIVCFTLYHYLDIRLSPTAIDVPEFRIRNLRYVWTNSRIEQLGGRGGTGSILPFDDHLEQLVGNSKAETIDRLQISNEIDLDHAVQEAIRVKLGEKQGFKIPGSADRFVPQGYFWGAVAIVLTGILTSLSALPQRMWEERYLADSTHLTVAFRDAIPDSTRMTLNGKTVRSLLPGEQSAVVEGIPTGDLHVVLEIRGHRTVKCTAKLARKREVTLSIDAFGWDDLSWMNEGPKPFELMGTEIPCSLQEGILPRATGA